MASLKSRSGGSSVTESDVERLRKELKTIRDRNIGRATFEEKDLLMSRLGIRVYPSEDLRSMRVLCRLDLWRDKYGDQSERNGTQPTPGSSVPQPGCRKVTCGGPPWSIGRTAPTFELKLALALR